MATLTAGSASSNFTLPVTTPEGVIRKTNELMVSPEFTVKIGGIL